MNKYSTIYNQSWALFKLVSFIPKRCAARPAAGSLISRHGRASSPGCSLAASGRSGLVLLLSTSGALRQEVVAVQASATLPTITLGRVLFV